MTTKKLLLIDGNSVAFRAFFALYKQVDRFVNSDGLHTSAIYAFKNMLDVVEKRYQPTNILVAFDAGKTTFRTEMFDDYKGTRAKTPSELMEQLPYLREMLDDLGIKNYDLANYEADDIIGTMAKIAESDGFETVIVTGDKDLTQLVTPKTQVDVTVRGVNEVEEYTVDHVIEKWGVTPDKIIDVKGLMGDSSDNYPGVTKVGEVTAKKLIQEHGSIEGIYQNIDQMKPSKLKENLQNDHDQALLSKKLASINTDAPIHIGLKDTEIQPVNDQKLREFYQKMEFKSFLDKLDNESSKPREIAGEREISYINLTEEILNQINFGDFDEMTFQIELYDENYHQSDILGFALGLGDKNYASLDLDLLENANLKAALKDEKIIKNVFDLKKTYIALNRLQIAIKSQNYGMMLASYLINNEKNSNDVLETAANYGFTGVKTDDEVYGKGASKKVPDETELLRHMAAKVIAIAQLKPKLLDLLQQHEQDDLLDQMEVPLAKVLSLMEIAGIKVNASTLLEMQQELAVRLEDIENKIYEQVGEKFNLNSPKQLGVILFEKLRLPVIKKTKTGYSTSVEVLEELRSMSPVVEEILEYRTINKIQSTYVTGLLKAIFPDEKIHTRYMQTLTATGRLSSVDPNLQNIPVRIDEGKKIRKAFVPSNPDAVIFSADYSQIELRVLSHVSGDENMQEAFKEGKDIHANTAMRIFNLADAREVTPLMRRQAKAVNFGIVYGISDFGLARNIGITRSQAKQFIEGYFQTYPKVEAFMKNSVQFAKENGFVETLMHRRRYLPDIHAKNFNLRSFAERTAMNSPIQGGAADIIKIAMINMQEELTKQNLKTKMLLQVHDELIFEVPNEELETIKTLVPKVMDSAVKLDVPLVVDYGYGKSWYEVK